MFNKIKLVKINEYKDNKSLTKEKKYISFLEPSKIYIPLFDSGYQFESLVQVGDYVKIGQLVALSKTKYELYYHSSISGVVTSLNTKMWTNSGKLIECIEIENDFKNNSETIKNNHNFIDLIKEAGIVGMGGSGFPTYVKYEEKKIDYLIVNMCECEPFITCDYKSTLEFTFKLINGIHYILDSIGGKKAFIAVKKKNKEIIRKLRNSIDAKITLVLIDDMYPVGWERYLVYKIFNKKYNVLPSEFNCVVNNVYTIISIYNSFKLLKPCVERMVTFSGYGLRNPVNVYCKVGTSIKEIIEYISGYENNFQNNVLTLGGPMTGVSIPNDNGIITKSLNCVLVNKYIQENENICIGCGRCANVCPVNLTPTEIMKYLKNKNKKELKLLKVSNCIQCGLCSYICPSRIELMHYMNNAKKLIRKI